MKLREDLIILTTHSRIDPAQKHSSVWRQIAEGFGNYVEYNSSISCLIHSLHENYSDIEEYLQTVPKSKAKNPGAMVLPLTPQQGEYEERLLKMLEAYEGFIVAINVPPDINARERLKNLRGYVGMNEVDAGKMAAKALLSRYSKPSCIYVPRDKPMHYGYDLRIAGIRNMAKLVNVIVREIDINDEKNSHVICQAMESAAFITLGPVGTAFAQKAKKEFPEKVFGIVAMDLNPETAAGIRSGDIICALIQHPREQGAKAAELAIKLLTKQVTAPYTEIFCGPTLVDLNNLSVFE